jgi:membrane protease YdiL (CAAX protease family)
MDPSESSPPDPDPYDPPQVIDPFAPDAPQLAPPAESPVPTNLVPANLAKQSNEARWWTPLAIAAISLGVFLAASIVMAVVAVIVVHGEMSLEVLGDPEALQEIARSRLGLLIVVVIPQLALVIPSIVAASLSPVPTRRRLGLVRGHWPLWVWFAAAAATPLVGMISGLVVGMFLEESDTLKEMTAIFREHGQNGFLIPLALMIGATPAFCEELLFRGYIQTRLTRSFGPVAGIIFASFLFAAFHMDFVHVVAVFPLGLFLGWVTWKSGSLFPAMLGHFVNNVISVVAVVLSPEDDPEVLALPTIAFTLAILGIGVLGMTSVLVASVIYRKPKS